LSRFVGRKPPKCDEPDLHVCVPIRLVTGVRRGGLDEIYGVFELNA
jgi:hypothetical protein